MWWSASQSGVVKREGECGVQCLVLVVRVEMCGGCLGR